MSIFMFKNLVAFQQLVVVHAFNSNTGRQRQVGLGVQGQTGPQLELHKETVSKKEKKKERKKRKGRNFFCIITS